MSDLSKYMKQIEAAFPQANASDLHSISKSVYNRVDRFLTERNAVRAGDMPGISVANESLSFDDAVNATGVEELISMVQSCGVGSAYVKPCCEAVLNIMDRTLHHSSKAAWFEQTKIDRSAVNNAGKASLADIYASDTVAALTNPGLEAFGVNTDVAVPDLKISVTVAIMNFHTRLLPRLLPTKTINQPEIHFTKEYLEVYDLANDDNESPRRRLLDLYVDPAFAANELKRIIPRKANDTENVVLTPDAADESKNLLVFGSRVNLLKLSLDSTKYGYTRINRTDLIAENVKLESVAFTYGSQQFLATVPLSLNRLTRVINADDVAIRNADIRFRTVLTSATKDLAGNTGLADLPKNADGSDKYGVQIEISAKPTVNLKFGDCDCLGAVKATIVRLDRAPMTEEDATATTGLLKTAAVYGYSIDARFSEENLRKTNIAVWTHRQPMSFDIPIGRNYVFDYAIGEENADENAVNLNKTIGIGQDHVAIRDVCWRTLQDVADRIKVVGKNPEDRADYVGTRYVAGDKVRPTVFEGTLDFTELNVIESANLTGDIKQKAISYLNAATTNVLYDSIFLQQLDGAGVTFRCVTSMTVLGKVLAQPHIHNHMDKEDARNIGDGIEYVMVLPNGVRLEFVTSTFEYLKDRILMWPIIKDNADSELNFATNYDYGTLVAHYTPSGEEAHHRLFANIRELPIVTNPVGLIIDIAGMDVVNAIDDNGVFVRPTFNIQTAAPLEVVNAPAEGEGDGG